MVNWLNRALSRSLPEQRIYFRTERTTRYVRLSPVTQAVLGTAATALFCWTLIITAALGIEMISAKGGLQQAEVLQRAYETRLNELSGERDQRALEAQTAQKRFYIALEQISLQQNDLLQAEEERRELATGLKIMQQKLQKRVKERDVAQKQSDFVTTQLQEVNGTLSTKLGSTQDIEETLAAVSDTLGKTAIDRDQSLAETQKLTAQLDDMLLEERLQRQRNEHIFGRLEEAVDVSLTPLERALNRSGINTESLLKEVRRGYSGTGGPLTPLFVSTKNSATDPYSERVNGLLKSLDRVNLMKLAAQKLPLAMPVKSSFRHTSGFGYRRDPKTGGRRMHKGADMAGATGTPIYATGDGVVTFAGRQSGYGRLIKIKHAQRFETLYAHLHRINVKAGQRVSRGTRIGDMGNSGRSTGTHLHYEVLINGNPVNPRTYMKAASDVF